MAEQFWWVIYPYLALAIMILGLLYRYSYAQIGWGAPSTEILEKKYLRIGSLMFHWGIIFAFFGHVMGILIPKWLYEQLGVKDELYHFNAIVFGGIVGLVTWLGLIVLIVRKAANKRLQRKAKASDFVTLFSLFIIVTLGTSMTTLYNLFVHPYEYRDTIGPWFRGILTFHPDAALMAGVPLLFKIHVVFSFALFAIIPFTKLVHFWTLPLRYPARSPMQYRSRVNDKIKRP
ncbi:respiratory nitrate reductase subunit gamma [Fodinisporobacter ferrooxydans]|uniref:Respiratory nitrate reductase subunit gamma n=1 Tax=Fodinisporobacter ferrooxydans TaxID=2901836 RepID=A0ABY4CVG2_9BACL|nr:respiratory nitrate reductase subunit gamma [Alicyclobacillaceae bacterium MYW30-H2]